MTIDQGRDDAAVEHVARPGHERRSGLEGAHGLLPVPVAFDLQTLRIIGAAAETPVLDAEFVLDGARSQCCPIVMIEAFK